VVNRGKMKKYWKNIKNGLEIITGIILSIVYTFAFPVLFYCLMRDADDMVSFFGDICSIGDWTGLIKVCIVMGCIFFFTFLVFIRIIVIIIEEIKTNKRRGHGTIHKTGE
jgi:hypothetical protein